MAAAVFLGGFVVSVYAGSGSCQAAAEAPARDAAAPEAFAAAGQKAVEVGNTICPVMGIKIDKKTKVTVEYDGKIYNLSCKTCIGEFKKNPEKYIIQVEKELDTVQAPAQQ